MANREHLAILKEGEHAWWTWRQAHPGLSPDLTNADLAEMDLDHYDLTDSDLTRADLWCANLLGANLERARLNGASLEGAGVSSATFRNTQLRGASLKDAFGTRANFDSADMTKAILADCNLSTCSFVRTTLCGAILDGAKCEGADFSCADLTGAKLRGAILDRAKLDHSILRGALVTELSAREAEFAQVEAEGLDWTGSILTRAFFRDAHMQGSCFRDAKLPRATLVGCDLRFSDFSKTEFVATAVIRCDMRHSSFDGALLECANIVETDLANATLRDCRVYGASAWNVTLDGCDQTGLIITRASEAPVTVDSLEMAQFIHLLLNNQKLRAAIETITSKVVLVLGRFSDTQKPCIEVIRCVLRSHGYVPVVFDFEGPRSRDVLETVALLAGLARFVVVDLSDPRSVPAELECIASQLPSVPVAPVLRIGQQPYRVFEHVSRRSQVLEVLTYADTRELESIVRDSVIPLAEQRSSKTQLRPGRTDAMSS